MYVTVNFLHKDNNLLLLLLFLYCEAVISENIFATEDGNVDFACHQIFI